MVINSDPGPIRRGLLRYTLKTKRNKEEEKEIISECALKVFIFPGISKNKAIFRNIKL